MGVSPLCAPCDPVCSVSTTSVALGLRGTSSCFRRDARTMGGQGIFQKQISDAPACLQKMNIGRAHISLEKATGVASYSTAL